jgi:predicted RNA binding protein YcfA (HicA-like mRNA interferase family)
MHSFNSIKRRLKNYRIYWDTTRGKGSHGVFVGPDKQGIRRLYTIPASQQKEIDKVYIRGICRRFGIDEKDLLSDK